MKDPCDLVLLTSIALKGGVVPLEGLGVGVAPITRVAELTSIGWRLEENSASQIVLFC